MHIKKTSSTLDEILPVTGVIKRFGKNHGEDDTFERRNAKRARQGLPPLEKPKNFSTKILNKVKGVLFRNKRK